MTERPHRAKILHEIEQLAAVFTDFSPALASLVAQHRDRLLAEGFTRAEAVQIAEGLQSAIVATILASARRPKHDWGAG